MLNDNAISDLLYIDQAVLDALARNHPVVALETTVLSHGLAWPTNVEVARSMDQAVRAGGAVPAVIGIAEGRARIGLGEDMVERFAREDGVMKVGRRDIAEALCRGGLGATTVSATMALAHLAGIGVFATGGIGGVHRGAESSFDISADLGELARTPVAVVCSGAKAILDLPRTLEALETLGVPVIGFGTDTFPAFTVASSGLALETRLDTTGEVARRLAAQWSLGTAAGAIIAVPVPDAAAQPAADFEAALAGALAAAEAAGIAGKALTPFLLSHIAQATGGRSVKANTALLAHNAAVAAGIAADLCGLARQ